MSSRILSRIFLGWTALVIAQFLAGMVVPVKASTPPHALAWVLVTDFLIAAAIGFVASKSESAGWPLACALALIPLCIGIANVIEGVVFLKNSAIPWRSLFLYNWLAYLFVVPMWRYLLGRGSGAPAHEVWLPSSAGTALWKFAVSDLLYVGLYFLAGSIIFPFVRDFYATQTLPSVGKIVALQLLVRGPIFIGVCLLLGRLIVLPRWAGAFAVGAVFAILSGIAPLLMPNPFFPDLVRRVHMAEVTSSNFLFAAGVRLLWGRSGESESPAQLRHAA